jgi:hypothetical protein
MFRLRTWQHLQIWLIILFTFCIITLEENTCLLEEHLDVTHEQFDDLVLLVGRADQLFLTARVINELFVQDVVQKRNSLVHRCMLPDQIEAFREEHLQELFRLGNWRHHRPCSSESNNLILL